MTDDTEHLFIYLFDIHIRIFFRIVFVQILCLFFIMLFVFLLLSYKCTFYMLDASALFDMYFANIVSQCVACLSISLIGFFREQMFYMDSPLTVLFFLF